MIKLTRSRWKAYTVLVLFIIFAITSYSFATSRTWGLSIIGMASVLLMLEVGRLRSESKKIVFLALILTLFFQMLGTLQIKYYGLVILLSLLPSLKLHAIKKKNLDIFTGIKKELDHKQKEIILKYKISRRKVKAMGDEINRFSKLYDLSREIEKAIRRREVINKALETFSFKMQINNAAFFERQKNAYIPRELRNIDEKTAAEWLEEIPDIKNKPGTGLFKFLLKSRRKILGLIICRGNMTQKQLDEAEVIISQITLGYEKTMLYEQVKRLSRIDGLTMLYLRMHFLERLSEEIKRARRENYKIAFMMADLDDFKKYNDTHGHPAGDRLLRDVAKIIKSNIYSSDFAGRYGGEEFCIYMPMADEKGTMMKASKIRKLISKKTPTTISMGIAYYPDNGETPDELIKAADDALYSAKEKGKNQIVEIETGL